MSFNWNLYTQWKLDDCAIDGGLEHDGEQSGRICERDLSELYG